MCSKARRVLTFVFLAASFSAAADQLDSWNLVAGGTVLNDSNLFRRPAGREVSDQVTVVNLGFRVNKAYSLQRFVVDASMSDSKYNKNSSFNYIGKNLSAAWLWSITPELHGNLSTNYSEALNSFVDYALTEKNIRTNNAQRFDLEWEGLGRLHVLGGINHTQVKNSQAILEDGDYTTDAVEYGAKYVFPSGSQVTLLGRNTNGEYKNRTLNYFAQYDNGFSQRDTEFRFLWPFTDKSRFDGRATYINREHDHFAERDYKGMTGALNYTLDLTGKIRLVAGVVRNLSSYQYSNFFGPSVSYYQADSYSFSPIWQVTSKTTLRGRYSHEIRDYRNTAQSFFKDTLSQSSVSVDWAPLRTVTVSFTAQHDTRGSTVVGRDFSSNALTASVNLVF